MLYRLLTYSYKKHFSAVFYIQMFRSCFPARCSTLPQYLSLAQPTACTLTLRTTYIEDAFFR